MCASVASRGVRKGREARCDRMGSSLGRIVSAALAVRHGKAAAACLWSPGRIGGGVNPHLSDLWPSSWRPFAPRCYQSWDRASAPAVVKENPI